MQESLFYNRIKNKQVREYIDNIPKYIKNKCILRKFEKGKVIALKGNYIEYIYISCEGNMQVKNEFENGFVYSFAKVNPVAYIGVMEIMANKLTYSSTLKTNTECIVIQISKQDFLHWISKDQKLTLEVLHFISKSMYEQSLRTGEVLAYPAICILINYLLDAYKSKEKEVMILEKTREDIASILGFSVRTINRNLKILKDEDLISVNRKGISITKEQFTRLSYKLESIK